MRRQALQQVCLSCRQAQPRQFAGVVLRRHIQISATPSATEPQHSIETPSNQPSSAGNTRYSVTIQALIAELYS
jgi:hypothetical protein